MQVVDAGYSNLPSVTYIGFYEKQEEPDQRDFRCAVLERCGAARTHGLRGSRGFHGGALCAALIDGSMSDDSVTFCTR